jgi:Tol biopolymer transport system component
MLTKDHALALSPAWSPDSRFIYFSSSRGGTLNIWKIAVDGSELRQITAGEGDDAELDVSGDGKRLIFATSRLHIGLGQLDLQSKPGDSTAKALALDSARNEFGPAYSPDGARIAFFTNLKGVENESIGVADVNGADATLLVRDSRINVFPRWSPDGTRVIYLSFLSAALNGGECRSTAISGGAPQMLLKGRDFGNFDVGRDGRLLFSNGDGAAQSFDPVTARPLPWAASLELRKNFAGQPTALPWPISSGRNRMIPMPGSGLPISRPHRNRYFVALCPGTR